MRVTVQTKTRTGHSGQGPLVSLGTKADRGQYWAGDNTHCAQSSKCLCAREQGKSKTMSSSQFDQFSAVAATVWIQVQCLAKSWSRFNVGHWVIKQPYAHTVKWKKRNSATLQMKLSIKILVCSCTVRTSVIQQNSQWNWAKSLLCVSA